MGYVDKHLLQGERVVYRAKVHWIIFVPSVVFVALGSAVAPFLREYWWAGAAIAALGLLSAIGPYTRYATSEFAVTDKRVLAKTGWLRRDSIETLLSKIEAIEVDQDFAGRFLGYGTITVIGTGGTHEPIPLIRSPFEFRRQVQGQIVAYDETVGQRGVVGAGSASSRDERECPFCAELILAKARVCKHCGRDVLPAREPAP